MDIRIPESEYDALRREAAARGLSLSALIRERLEHAYEVAATCSLCDGKDWRVPGEPCPRCHGAGVLYAREVTPAARPAHRAG